LLLASPSTIGFGHHHQVQGRIDDGDDDDDGNDDGGCNGLPWQELLQFLTPQDDQAGQKTDCNEYWHPFPSLNLLPLFWVTLCLWMLQIKIKRDALR